MRDYLKNWFPGKPSLKNVTAAQLRERRLALDNEARQWQHKLDDLDVEKNQLVKAFAEAKYLNQSQRLRVLARQFEALKAQIGYVEANHSKLIKGIRVLLGLEHLKDNEVLLTAGGQGAVFNMNFTDLQGYIETATAQGELNMSKLDHVLYTLEDAQARASIGEDASTNQALNELGALAEEQEMLLPDQSEIAAIEAEIKQMESQLNPLNTPTPQSQHWELKLKS